MQNQDTGRYGPPLLSPGFTADNLSKDLQHKMAFD